MGSTLDSCQPWYVGIRYNGCLDAKEGMDLKALLPRSRLVTCPIFWWTTGDTNRQEREAAYLSADARRHHRVRYVGS